MEKHESTSKEQDEKRLKRAQRIRDALAIHAARVKGVRVGPKPTIAYQGAEYPLRIGYSYNNNESPDNNNL